MRNLKKFTALALTAAITLSMAACGSKESADDAANGSGEPAASAAAADLRSRGTVPPLPAAIPRRPASPLLRISRI